MWYVVQTKTDNEHLVMELFEKIAIPGCYKSIFVPMFEDVKKKNGSARIQLRRLFPGYFFIETDTPKLVFDTLKKIPEFIRLLGSEEDDDGAVFTPVEGDDQKFLESLMENGVMRVSYIQRSLNGRIEKILGPLSSYSNRVVKFDISRRRAIVQVDIFGKIRKLKFGLWTESDEHLPWIDALLVENAGSDSRKLLKGTDDIGIHPGDKVVDETGIYEDQIFTVNRVDIDKRIIDTYIKLFGTVVKVQLNADEVRKI